MMPTQGEGGQREGEERGEGESKKRVRWHAHMKDPGQNPQTHYCSIPVLYTEG